VKSAGLITAAVDPGADGILPGQAPSWTPDDAQEAVARRDISSTVSLPGEQARLAALPNWALNI
jgi:hypothetical protein